MNCEFAKVVKQKLKKPPQSSILQNRHPDRPTRSSLQNIPLK